MKSQNVATRVAFAGGLLLAAVARAAYPAPLEVARTRGIVATANAEASAAAASVLARGGNAVDGAVAAALALGVTNPESSGLGGGGFAVIWLAKARRAVVLDFRETAPAQASRDMFLVDGKADPARSKWGGLAVAVPAEPAGLAELEARYGKVGLAAAARPAIKLAKGGFSASRHLVAAISPSPPLPAGVVVDEALRHLWRPGGKPLLEGQKVRRPALARTLARFAKQGAAGFYQGPVARQIVAAVQARGGILTAADLPAYRPIWREPQTGRFRGRELFTAPPPAGGLTAVEALQILDARPALGPLDRGSSAADHLLLEAFTHAFADRAHDLGDPAFVKVPAVRLGAAQYAAQLAARILPNQVLPPAAYGSKATGPADPPHDHGTTHLCVADGEGNVVALTTTVNLLFGSLVMGGDSGVVLNNEMDDFSAHPGAPNAFGLVGSWANAIAPGKRPLSSMSPMIVTQDGQAVLCAGAAGGPTIVTATVQTVVNVIDYGLDVAAAVDAPRVHAQWLPRRAVVEDDVARDVVEGLERRGHKVVRTRSIAAAQAVGLSPTGLSAASDPRYGGAPAAP